MKLSELENKIRGDLADNIQQPDISPHDVLKLIAVAKAANDHWDKHGLPIGDSPLAMALSELNHSE